MFPLLVALLLATSPPLRPEPFDPHRPPEPLPPQQSFAPPVEVHRLSRDTVWLERRDGHVASTTFSVFVGGLMPRESLASARCVDLLWPGHTHIMVGSGHTVQDGFDLQAFPSGASAGFLVKAVAGYEDVALEYVRSLIAGTRPAAAQALPSGSFWRKRTEPDVLRLVLWGLESPHALDTWSVERCLEYVRTAGARAPIRVAVTAATRPTAERIVRLARGRFETSPSTPSSHEPTVFLVAWKGAPFDGVAIAGRPIEPSPTAPSAAIYAVLRSTTARGRLAKRLRNDLGAAYTPFADVTSDGRIVAGAEVTPDKRDAALRMLLAEATTPDTWRAEAEGLASSWEEVLWEIPSRYAQVPGNIWKWVDVLSPPPHDTKRSRHPPDPVRVARELADAFAHPDVVLVVPNIDDDSIDDACATAATLGRRHVTVVDLPDGGSHVRSCGP